MSLLTAPSTPANSSRRMANSARIASNILGTPWPILWGTRDLSGTLIAWTNHTFNAGGATGKGGGQVSSGEKDYRTFALGFCLGPCDSVNSISFDNQVIWTGPVTIASAATVATATQGVGSVLLSTSDQNARGTICFYFGLETQTQDPILATYIPNAPFYRGMVYAVFHGPRAGTRGFRIGNADTLPQITVNITRIPPNPPGVPFTASTQAGPGNAAAEVQTVSLAADVSAFTGGKNIFYVLTATAGNLNSQLSVSWAAQSGADTPGSATITNGVAFAVGTLGLMCTLSWGSNGSSVMNSDVQAVWDILITSNAAALNNGANIAGMLYELLTTNVAGFGLNPALVDPAQFNAFAIQANYAGLNFATTEKGDARNLIKDILGYVQGALTISNGLIAPRLMGYVPGAGVSISLTLEADDIVGYKVRPGAWYEIAQHVTVKYRDTGRLYRDTILSLPGAGDVGDDQKLIEIDMPMVTDLPTARLIGLRMKALQTLPKKPDTLICTRAAFRTQFGDPIALNNPSIGTLPAAFGYQPGVALVVLAVREQADQLIEVDVTPDVFGYLPVSTIATGGGGGGGGGGTTPITPIAAQDAFELPFDWATDGSKRFLEFAARPDPDAQGFSLWASSEPSPVDYNEVDSDALFCAGGKINSYTPPRYTMDRQATIQFTATSQDIDAWQSVSDNDWFGYQFLVLLGGGNSALLFAAKELLFLGGSSFEIRGLFGPLSDTLAGSQGTDIWVFALQPPYNILGQPSWVNGTLLTFKGIPFGSRLSPTLADADEAQVTVISRAIRPRMAQNPVANGRGQIFFPTYSGDIDLAWDLCNRGFGFGAETNPSEFDPAVASEVQQCQVDVVVASTVVNTYTVNTRALVQTSTLTVHSQSSFDVGSVAGLQPGDRVSLSDNNGNEYFGRILTIAGLTVNLVSPIAANFALVSDLLVTRYESCGFVYTAAMNTTDNAGLASSVTFKIYSFLNGLRALNPATITVNQS